VDDEVGLRQILKERFKFNSLPSRSQLKALAASFAIPSRAG